MIKSKCYSVPKSGAYRKVKFEIAVTGGYCVLQCAEKKAGKVKWKQTRQ